MFGNNVKLNPVGYTSGEAIKLPSNGLLNGKWKVALPRTCSSNSFTENLSLPNLINVYAPGVEQRKGGGVYWAYIDSNRARRRKKQNSKEKEWPATFEWKRSQSLYHTEDNPGEGQSRHNSPESKPHVGRCTLIHFSEHVKIYTSTYRMYRFLFPSIITRDVSIRRWKPGAHTHTNSFDQTLRSGADGRKSLVKRTLCKSANRFPSFTCWAQLCWSGPLSGSVNWKRDSTVSLLDRLPAGCACVNKRSQAKDIHPTTHPSAGNTILRRILDSLLLYGLAIKASSPKQAPQISVSSRPERFRLSAESLADRY